MTDLSFVLPILCDDVPWMTLEEFPSFFFYMLSLCLHFITCSHWGQCSFQVWGKGLGKYIFCFLFLLFLLLFLFLYSVLIFVFISFFCFYLAIFCSVCVFCSGMLFYFCCCFLLSILLYLFCFVDLLLLLFLHTKIKKIQILLQLFSDVFVEFRHFLMFL